MIRNHSNYYRRWYVKAHPSKVQLTYSKVLRCRECYFALALPSFAMVRSCIWEVSRYGPWINRFLVPFSRFKGLLDGILNDFKGLNEPKRALFKKIVWGNQASSKIYIIEYYAGLFDWFGVFWVEGEMKNKAILTEDSSKGVATMEQLHHLSSNIRLSNLSVDIPNLLPLFLPDGAPGH